MNDIVKGDLVMYRYTTNAFNGSSSAFQCRVHAKVSDTDPTVRIVSKDSGLYVVVPTVPIDDIPILMFDKVDYEETWGELELEWGDVPEQFSTARGTQLEIDRSEYSIAEWKVDGRCTRCGDEGYWHALALFCPHHGRIL